MDFARSARKLGSRGRKENARLPEMPTTTRGLPPYKQVGEAVGREGISYYPAKG
jgi:hypothetical protein